MQAQHGIESVLVGLSKEPRSVKALCGSFRVHQGLGGAKQ